MGKTMAELARDAIQVQDAVNPLGLSKSFAEVVTDLRVALEAEGVYGTDAICEHPIFRLWVSKLHDLGGMGLSDVNCYHRAYEACTVLGHGNKVRISRAAASQQEIRLAETNPHIYEIVD